MYIHLGFDRFDMLKKMDDKRMMNVSNGLLLFTNINE